MNPEFPNSRLITFRAFAWWLCIVLASSMGCRISNPDHPNHGMASLPPVLEGMPKELSKVALPPYVIEPPDVLVIEGIHIVPKGPYRLEHFDSVIVEAPFAIPTQPIKGSYVVDHTGEVQLGPSYGSVSVIGQTIEEAHQAIEAHLATIIRNPTAQVRLDRFRQAVTVSGSYRVGPDGRIHLGGYGSLVVTGLTVPQAERAVEKFLSESLENPQVAISVASNESKGVYVIFQGGGVGDSVIKLPSSGNETVLDALAHLEGLQQTSSKKIWISRPRRSGAPTILPVDWFAITERGVAATNYQLLPGDRVFVAEDGLIGADSSLAKFTSPWERAFGFTILGVGTASRLTGSVLEGGGNPNNSGF